MGGEGLESGSIENSVKKFHCKGQQRNRVSLGREVESLELFLRWRICNLCWYVDGNHPIEREKLE